jgi:hypothetical protein
VPARHSAIESLFVIVMTNKCLAQIDQRIDKIKSGLAAIG